MNSIVEIVANIAMRDNVTRRDAFAIARKENPEAFALAYNENHDERGRFSSLPGSPIPKMEMQHLHDIASSTNEELRAKPGNPSTMKLFGSPVDQTDSYLGIRREAAKRAIAAHIIGAPQDSREWDRATRARIEKFTSGGDPLSKKPLQHLHDIASSSNEELRAKPGNPSTMKLFGSPVDQTDSYLGIRREAAKHAIAAHLIGAPQDSREWDHATRKKIEGFVRGD
jgi:hypothetical protein